MIKKLLRCTDMEWLTKKKMIYINNTKLLDAAGVGTIGMIHMLVTRDIAAAAGKV